MSVALLFTFALLTTARVSTAGQPAPEVPRPDQITFTVVRSGKNLSEPDVDVLLVGPNKELAHVGRTDELGKITIAKDSLRAARGGALLFCKQYCQCSAERLDNERLFGYDEKVVAITGVILR